MRRVRKSAIDLNRYTLKISKSKYKIRMEYLIIDNFIMVNCNNILTVQKIKRCNSNSLFFVGTKNRKCDPKRTGANNNMFMVDLIAKYLAENIYD